MDMSDEGHIHLYGCANKQINPFRDMENLCTMQEKSLHLLKTVGWCTVHAKSVMLRQVDGKRFKYMLNYILLPQLDELKLENISFRQDGVTAQTAQAITEIRFSYLD